MISFSLIDFDCVNSKRSGDKGDIMARGVRNKKVKRNRSVKRKTRGAIQAERDIQKTNHRLRKALNNEPVDRPNHSLNMLQSALKGEYKPATRRDLNIDESDLNEQVRELSVPPDGVDSLVRERRMTKYSTLVMDDSAGLAEQKEREEKSVGDNPLKDKDPLKIQEDDGDVAIEQEASATTDEETVNIKAYVEQKLTHNKRKLNYREKKKLKKAEFYENATPYLGGTFS
eukprot:gb/GECG01010835.1/.p1 GENE.gb/GECG01010835.1/~~gb/GECG01010835.1/.p1  ORF type:complete len:229 (+),score=45.21 gb/GECG01010835.1/:1-687(+)